MSSKKAEKYIFSAIVEVCIRIKLPMSPQEEYILIFLRREKGKGYFKLLKIQGQFTLPCNMLIQCYDIKCFQNNHFGIKATGIIVITCNITVIFNQSHKVDLAVAAI